MTRGGGGSLEKANLRNGMHNMYFMYFLSARTACDPGFRVATDDRYCYPFIVLL